jgi:hypothetical protein
VVWAGSVPTASAAQDDHVDGSIGLWIFVIAIFLSGFFAAVLTQRCGLIKTSRTARTVGSQTDSDGEAVAPKVTKPEVVQQIPQCIYVTGAGEKFHMSSACQGLRSRMTPLKGFKPCSYCAG